MARKTGGKIRTSRRSHQHFSRKPSHDEEEDEVDNPLGPPPAVGLTLGEGKTLPTITFHAKLPPKSVRWQLSFIIVSKGNSRFQFTFSSLNWWVVWMPLNWGYPYNLFSSWVFTYLLFPLGLCIYTPSPSLDPAVQSQHLFSVFISAICLLCSCASHRQHLPGSRAQTSQYYQACLRWSMPLYLLVFISRQPLKKNGAFPYPILWFIVTHSELIHFRVFSRHYCNACTFSS